MKLNLGCGTDLKEGYVNCDMVAVPGIDRVIDLKIFPYPFADGCAEEIYCAHVLEHLDCDLVKVMEEFHRMLRPGGLLRIRVPFYNHCSAWIDPTHRRAFTYESFSYFVKGHKYGFYTTRHFSSCDVKAIPTKLGTILPEQLRMRASKVFGHIVEELDIRLVK